MQSQVGSNQTVRVEATGPNGLGPSISIDIPVEWNINWFVPGALLVVHADQHDGEFTPNVVIRANSVPNQRPAEDVLLETEKHVGGQGEELVLSETLEFEHPNRLIRRQSRSSSEAEPDVHLTQLVAIVETPNSRIRAFAQVVGACQESVDRATIDAIVTSASFVAHT